jgi:putative adhesin
MTAPLPMTTGRRVALLLGLPVALAVIGWTGLTAVAYAGQASYPVRLAVPVHGSTVSLSAGAGDVRVTQAPGSQLNLTGTAHYSVIQSTVTWHNTRSGVIVTPRCHFVAGNCSFDFHAVVPEGKQALISTGSGNVTLASLSGPVIAGTGSGDIRAENLPDAVSMQTGSGDISGATVSGAKVTLKTGSGDISITGLTGAHVIASAGSGDITLTFTKVPDRVRVDNGSGNVTLVLPPGSTPYQVNANTDSGGRVVTVPTNLASPHVITISDGSGNISITN